MDDKLTPKQLKEFVSITSERLKVKYPSIIEKDYYVTPVIHTLSEIENEDFRLVFVAELVLLKRISLLTACRKMWISKYNLKYLVKK